MSAYHVGLCNQSPHEIVLLQCHPNSKKEKFSISTFLLIIFFGGFFNNLYLFLFSIFWAMNVWPGNYLVIIMWWTALYKCFLPFLVHCWSVSVACSLHSKIFSKRNHCCLFCFLLLANLTNFLADLAVTMFRRRLHNHQEIDTAERDAKVTKGYPIKKIFIERHTWWLIAFF